MLMRAPAGMTSLHSGHEKEDEASGRTVPRQCAQSSWLPPQGMILGSRSPSSKGSRHTGQSRALMASSAVKPGLAPTPMCHTSLGGVLCSSTPAALRALYVGKFISLRAVPVDSS